MIELNKKLINIFIVNVLVLMIYSANAQQIPLQSHYFFQEHIINPAYTGSRTYNPIYLGYRNQWSDFPGSPETFTLGVHYLREKNHGIGGGFFRDNLGGAYSQTGAQFNYAHHVQIEDKASFSLGLGTIFNQFSGDYSNLDPNDPAVQIGNESKLATDLSLGAHFSSKGLKLGLSVNNLMESSISDYGVVPADNRLNRQFHLMGSYKVDFDSSFALEPMFLVRTIGSTPTQLDATILAHIKQIVSLGLTYRTGDALAFITGIEYKNLLLFYSYDMTTSSAQSYTGQTHELTLGTRIIGKIPQMSSDKDFDGVADDDDSCPLEAGPKKNNGCPYPDSDGDGISDNDDKCPQLKGESKLAGCPDRDKDGIADLMDECPDIPGSAKNGGCPKISQLHILDNKGRTVTIVNELENGEYSVNGISHKYKYYFLLETNKKEVPDSIYITIVNQDGEHRSQARLGESGYYELVKQAVKDEKQDEKQEVIEIELKEEEKKVLKEAFGALEFETSKAIIKETSYPSLLELVKLMDANSSYRLYLVGHTDNVGNPMNNLMLSKKRADAVRHFLVQFGIDDKRFIVSFEGESSPIESNDTKEGRQKNRRVEMTIIK